MALSLCLENGTAEFVLRRMLIINCFFVRQIFDTAITVGSFVLDLVFIEQMSSTKGEETIALLVIFLLWRVLRLVNGMAAIESHQKHRAKH